MAVDRNELIRRLYYQELGRNDATDEEINYWAGTGLDENALRSNMRNSAGLSGESVTAPLLADQSYAAYLRGMQFNESQIQSSLQAAQEAAARKIQGQRPTWDQQRTDGAQNIDSGYERRQNRSGKRLVDLNKQRSAVDNSQLQFETGINEAKGQMERDAAANIASLRRERAEQEIGARDRLTMRSAGMA